MFYVFGNPVGWAYIACVYFVMHQQWEENTVQENQSAENTESWVSFAQVSYAELVKQINKPKTRAWTNYLQP